MYSPLNPITKTFKVEFEIDTDVDANRLMLYTLHAAWPSPYYKKFKKSWTEQRLMESKRKLHNLLNGELWSVWNWPNLVGLWKESATYRTLQKRKDSLRCIWQQQSIIPILSGLSKSNWWWTESNALERSTNRAAQCCFSVQGSNDIVGYICSRWQWSSVLSMRNFNCWQVSQNPNTSTSRPQHPRGNGHMERAERTAEMTLQNKGPQLAQCATDRLHVWPQESVQMNFSVFILTFKDISFLKKKKIQSYIPAVSLAF